MLLASTAPAITPFTENDALLGVNDLQSPRASCSDRGSRVADKVGASAQ